MIWSAKAVLIMLRLSEQALPELYNRHNDGHRVWFLCVAGLSSSTMLDAVVNRRVGTTPCMLGHKYIYECRPGNCCE